MTSYRHVWVFLVWFWWPSLSAAQCVNSIETSCSVYSTCFEKHCNCAGSEDEYLISFGMNYCNAFLSEHEFSSTGKLWRDSALRCLQESLVPIIPLDESKTHGESGTDHGFPVLTKVDCLSATDHTDKPVE